jgi:hypothetical protein
MSRLIVQSNKLKSYREAQSGSRQHQWKGGCAASLFGMRSRLIFVQVAREWSDRQRQWTEGLSSAQAGCAYWCPA